MAEDIGNEITEDIVLELKTNFEAELRNAAAQYSGFQKKAGNVSRSIESNINSMYRQVSSNLSSMMQGVQKTVASSINMTRGAMRETQNESIKLSKTYENYVNRMLQLQNKVRGVADDKIMKPSGKAEAIKGLDETAKTETIKAANDMYMQLGSISKNASQVILDSLNQSLNGVKNLAKGTKDTLVGLEVDVKNNKTIESALSAKDGIDKLQKQLDTAKKALKDQAKQVVAAEKEMQNARMAMTGQTNAELKIKQEEYFKQTVKNVTMAQKAYHDTEKEIAKLANTFDVAKSKISKGIGDIVASYKTSASDSRVRSELGFKKIKEEYESLFNKYKKLSQIRFIKKEAVSEFKSSVDVMKERINKYNKGIGVLADNIRKLEQLHKKGLAPNIGPIIEARKTQLNELKANVKEITAMSNRATSQAEQLAKHSSKNLFSSGWEMVRNFRWQVAGLIYLVTKGINLVKNTFFKAMSEIQKFRTDAMAIAAATVYSSIDSSKVAFEKGFNYSIELMQKLELQAAKTILTLEDMTMLTKTFTQAGIIPKTDEDVKKIATIGTAIKVLTEGMANAGVQMRQELYAIIQGRQRATDQVAMMFKMIGINITKLLEDAKKEGKDMMDVLAKALEPFAEANKKMEKEYAAQINQLEIIWNKLKRIGGENTFFELSASIREFNNSLMDSDTGKLTEMGKKFAYYMGLAYESLRLSVGMLKNIFESGSEIEKSFARWEFIFRGVMGALWGISTTLDVIATTVGIIADGIGGMAATLYAFFTEGPKAAINMAKIVGDDITKRMDNLEKRSIESFDAIHNSAEKLKGIFENTAFGADLENIKLPYANVVEDLAKIQNDIVSATKGSLDGIAKINYEYEQNIEKYKETTVKLNANIKAINEGMNKIKDPKKLEEWTLILQGQKEALASIGNAVSAYARKRDKELSGLAEKERQKIESVKAEYLNLLESMEVAPKSPEEQIWKKYDKLFISLDKFIEKERVNLKKLGVDIDVLWKAFNQGADNSFAVAAEEAKMELNSFLESLKSHDVLSPLERITNEMNKQRNIAKEKFQFDEESLKLALAKVDVAEKERIALERINLELAKQNTLTETARGKNEILKFSIRPIDQQRAAINDLEYDYKQSSDAIKAEIESIQKKWNNTSDFGEATGYEIQIASLEERLKDLEKILNYNKEQVQKPFWNDLKEMSQGWFDQFADVLNEAAFDLDSFSENFQEFTRNIAREASRAWIKRNITDNMMNLLPSFGAGKNEEKTKTQIVDVMKEGWIETKKMFKDGFDWFVKISGEGFKWLKDGLTSIFNSLASLLTKENISSAWGAVAGIFGGASADGSTSTTKMAEGGIITEPIIGRGLRSGTTYELGEKGDEVVIPMNKMGSSSNSLSISVPVSVSGGADNKMIARLKAELQKSVEETTLRVIKEHS